ncbi:hypothetical protein Tco_0653971 [Tanacetum coccineum]|uniref:Uncharacterized protein n=1 Tax=Tanacetum coccineum TaxID=301880 RepID=A0ABQ4X205_9ASTR
MDSPDTEVDWQEDLYHETEYLFVELDQAIGDVVVQNNVPQEVDIIKLFMKRLLKRSWKWLMIKMKHYFDQEVDDNSLDDEEVEQGRPSNRTKVTQKEMVKDEKAQKG